MLKIRASLLAAAFFCAAPLAQADEFSPMIEAFYHDNIAAWVGDPVLVEAIRAQNGTTAGLSEDQIIDLDNQWRAQVGAADTPIIDPVLSGPAADFLRGQVDAAGGVITEVFAMDARGLNVAASDVTSDYWQGDEAKFQKTYPMGAGALFVDDVEFDESTQTYQGQVSVVVVDPATNEPIGALTIGLNAEALL